MQGYTIGIAALLVLVVGPLSLGIVGLIATRRKPAEGVAPARRDWKLPVASALLFTLAFNLTFFLQELFLVLPKAMTPGLQPTLYHNNHGWTGENPLADLFQGTGALATLLCGLVCMGLLSRGHARSATLRLFLFWMGYCGCLMALLQCVVGAISAGSDVGMAMDYLHLGATTKMFLAIVALVAIASIALWLVRRLPDAVGGGSERFGSPSRLVLLVVTLPALAAVALIVPFRIPREPIEVVVVPLAVVVVGVAWMQAGAWRIRPVSGNGARAVSIAYPFVAALLLLAFFQVVLRPGIAFY